MKRLTNNNKEIPTLVDNAEYWLKVYFKLKEYESLEEQGRLLKPPCRVGDITDTGAIYPAMPLQVVEDRNRWKLR